MGLTGATSVTLGALLPSIVTELRLDDVQAGLLAASPGLGYMLAVLAAGALSDRLGAKRIWVSGAAAAIVALLGLAAAPIFGWLLPAALVLGFVPGLFDGSVNPLLSQLALGRSGSVFNRVHASFGVGATLTPFLISLALRCQVAWRLQFAVLSLPALLLAIGIAALSLPPTLHAGQWSPRLSVLAARPVVLAALAALCYGGIEATLISWTALYLTRAREVLPATASLAVALLGATLMVGRFATGLVAERLGYQRLIVWGGLGAALGLAVMVLAPGQVLPWIGLACAGLALATIFATLLADVTSQAAGMAGVVTGLVCASSGVGKLLLPWLVGQTAQVAGISAGLGLTVGFALLLALAYSRR